MWKKFWKALGIAIGLLICLVFIRSWYISHALPIEYKSQELIFEDNFDDVSLNNWDLYQNADGERIPLSKENYSVDNGILNLGIHPRPDFQTQEKPYNNSYTLTKMIFQNGKIYKFVCRMRIPENYKGSTGCWLNEVGEDGEVLNKSGFVGAFGVSYLSPESESSGYSGLRFILSKGFTPRCTLKVGVQVDPTQWNDYSIVWDGTQLDAYVNDIYVGSCRDTEGLLTKVKDQFWTDNYLISGFFRLIPNFLGLSALNPDAPQFVQYDYFKVYILK